MNLLSPISTIMTKNPVTLGPEDVLLNVRDIFDKQAFHHIPILDRGSLVGVISKSDYLFFCRTFDGKNADKRLQKFRLSNYQVSDIMTSGVATLESSDKINVALEVFKENIFHSIPIVDNGELVGILTTYDIIKTLSNDKGATNTYTT